MQANGTNGMVDPGHGQPRNGATVSTGPQDPPVPIDNNASRLSIKIRRTSTSASTSASASEVPDRPAALANNGPTLNPIDLADGNAVAGPSRPMATSSIPAAPSGASTRKGVRPVFDYPRPTPEQLEDELPPLRHDQDVPLGLLLDRVVGKGYKGMRVLVEQTLPPLQPRERPLPVIRYAKSTRQTVLKYLAVLRWKLAVDTVQYTPDPSSSFPAHPNGVGINNQDNDISSIKMEAEAASPEDAMTPAQGMMNGDVNGSAGGHGKGKGRTEDAAGGDGGQAIGQRIKRGRLLDIRRLEEFMKHQNAQHAMAVTHIQHVCAGIENLRIRNPDLLTSLALLSSGTYPRLPSSLTEPFDTKPPLTNGDIINTLRNLDGLIKYRLRCVDHVPAEMQVLEVKDGRVAFAGGRRGKRRRIARAPVEGDLGEGKERGHGSGAERQEGFAGAPSAEVSATSGRESTIQGQAQWRAEVTWVNFDDYAQAPRWWLTGVEWWWRERPSSTSPPIPSAHIDQSSANALNEAPDRSMDIDEDDRLAAPSTAHPSSAIGKATTQHEGGARKRLKGLERQRVLDYANQVILAPRPVDDVGLPGQPHSGQGSKAVIGKAVGDAVSMAGTPPSAQGAIRQHVEGDEDAKLEGKGERVDAPLVRLHNFIQHLSLTYQLEILYGQAIRLAQGPWRGSLAVDMNREKGELTLRYWTRARPAPIVPANRRPAPPATVNPNKTPLVGGILTVAVIDESAQADEGVMDGVDGLGLIDGIGQDGTVPTDEVLKQRLRVKWEVGDGGEGGGWKAGLVLGEGEEGLELDPISLSIEGILAFATQRHAAHLTRTSCTPLLTLPRINIFSSQPPEMISAAQTDRTSSTYSRGMPDEDVTLPESIQLRIPLPLRAGQVMHRRHQSDQRPIPEAGAINADRDTPALLVRVSDKTGQVEITDTGASSAAVGPSLSATEFAFPSMPGGEGYGSNATRNIEDRARRTSMACQSVNDGRTRLGDDLGRLVTAVILEHVENQLRQLGYAFLRKLAMRSQDMTSNDLHPATCVFIPLPTIAPSPTPFGNGSMGILNRSASSSSTVLPSHTTHYLLVRTTVNGLVFELLRMARVQQEGGVGWRLVVGDKLPVDLDLISKRRPARSHSGMGLVQGDADERSRFEVDNADLRDLYIYCNAMVAQSILEQQLKDRSIPYTLQAPPATGPGAPQSRAAVAGMVPALVMNVADLLKDPRAAEVARSKVYMLLKGWWKGGKCTADTIVRLLHPPTAARPAATTKSGQDGINGTNGINGASGPEEAKTGDTNPTVKTPKTPATPNPIATTKTSRAAREEGITFDQASSVVTFHADDLARCVPLFLEQWERLSKVIIIAGEVSKLARSSSFRDLRMISFDLRSAIFAYAPQHYCSITYDPAMDAYISSFSRTAQFGASPSNAQAGLTGQSPVVNGGYGQTPKGQALSASAQTPMSTMQALTPLTPAVAGPNGAQHTGAGGAVQGLTPAATTPGTFNAASPGEGAPVNPHEAMAGLLSWRLNELVKERQDVAARFIKLLCATLPLLSTVEDLQAQHASLIPDTPKVGDSPTARMQAAQNRAQFRNITISPVQLVIRSIEKYKLVWDVEGERRYAVDAKYLPGRNDAVVFSDAAAAILPFGIGGSGTTGHEAEREDESCGPLTAISGWKDGLVRRVWQGLREESLAGMAGVEPSLAAPVEGKALHLGAPSTPSVPAPRPAPSAPHPATIRGDRSDATARLPPMCLDGDTSLLVPVNMLESAIRRIAREVEAALSSPVAPTSHGPGGGAGEDVPVGDGQGSAK